MYYIFNFSRFNCFKGRNSPTIVASKIPARGTSFFVFYSFIYFIFLYITNHRNVCVVMAFFVRKFYLICLNSQYVLFLSYQYHIGYNRGLQPLFTVEIIRHTLRLMKGCIKNCINSMIKKNVMDQSWAQYLFIKCLISHCSCNLA